MKAIIIQPSAFVIGKTINFLVSFFKMFAFFSHAFEKKFTPAQKLKNQPFTAYEKFLITRFRTPAPRVQNIFPKMKIIGKKSTVKNTVKF